jgi:aminobenzoyl-glutamate utilization protein B
MNFFLNILIILICFLGFAQKQYDHILNSIDSNQSQYEKVAQEIWTYAEMGYQEEKSSSLLQKTLAEQGFLVKSGVAEIPTAFVATYGSGGPVIGILGEFDALPGLSQQAVPYKLSNNAKAGHACGHHCLEPLLRQQQLL